MDSRSNPPFRSQHRIIVNGEIGTRIGEFTAAQWWIVASLRIHLTHYSSSWLRHLRANMKNFHLILFLLSPCASEDCRHAYPSTSERVSRAALVYFGYVTAIHLKSFESQKMKDGHVIPQDILVALK